jgi:hypothetical protein
MTTRDVKATRFRIAAGLCALAVVALLLTVRRVTGVGLLGLSLDVLFFLVVSYLAWRTSLSRVLRTVLIVVAAVVVAPPSVYLSHLAFRKIEFHPAFMIQDFLFHLVAAGALIGLTFLAERAVFSFSFEGRRAKTRPRGGREASEESWPSS